MFVSKVQQVKKSKFETANDTKIKIKPKLDQVNIKSSHHLNLREKLFSFLNNVARK
jgi:hypothetical protein